MHSTEQDTSSVPSAEERYWNLFENNVAGAFQTAVQGGIIDANRTLVEMLEYDSAEELMGVDVDELYFDPDDRETWLSRILESGYLRREQVRLRKKDGSPLWVLGSGYLTHDNEHGAIVVGTVTNITEEIRLAKRLRELAFEDSLTGLPNRRAFEQESERLLAMADRGEGRAAVLYIDLNGFKKINDEHGHAEGDRVLEIVGERLQGEKRQSDMIARIGGDEFAILLTNVTSPEDGRSAAERYKAAIERPIEGDAPPQDISPKMGLALSPEHGRSLKELVSRADAAMYEAGRTGQALVVAGSDQE